MISYGPLSKFYDELTRDVVYSDFIDFYKTEFANDGGEFRLILDLCCGTGTLAELMSKDGFEVIAVDSSEDMLMVARSKTDKVLFICQDAAELDLYGTVDACYSSLDSINYIPPEELYEVFRRLKLFIRPDGLFIFDIREEEWLKSMDGYISVDESDDMLCIWRADYEENILTYGLDLFTKSGNNWKRDKEEHTEYAHRTEDLYKLLKKSGFNVIKTESKGDRLFIVAKA